MAEDFSINIGIKLNDNNLTKELERIQGLVNKNTDLKLNIGFDKTVESTLKTITSHVGELSKQIQTVNNTKMTINANDLVDNLKKVLDTEEDVRKNLSKFGNVAMNSNSINETDNKMRSLIATVETANQKFKLLYSAIEQNNREEGKFNVTGYQFEKILGIADNTDKALKDLSKFKSEAQKTLNDINNTGFADGNIFKNLQEQINNLNTSNFKDKISQINSSLKELQTQAKNTEQSFNNIAKFSNSSQGKINNLFSNDVVPKDKIINIEAKVSGLQGNESQEYIKSLEVEINKLIEEEKLLTQENKNYQNSVSQTFKEEGNLIQYVAQQFERLKNIQSSYSNKLDTGSTGYIELKSQYESIVNTLEKYRQENRELTTEEKTGITSRINDLKTLGNEYTSINNFIKQQISTLDNLSNKYKTVVDSFEVDNIKNKLGSLTPSTNNIVGSKNNITQQIAELETLAKEKQRLSNMGNVVSTIGSNLNMGSSLKEIEQYIKSIAGYKANITSMNESLSQTGNRVKEINYAINNGNQVNKFKLSIDETSGSVRNLSTGMQDLSSRHATFTESLKQSISGLVNFTIAGTALFGTLNQLKEGYEFINDLSKTQTNIEMINGMSQGEIKGLTGQYSQLASQMHSTVQEVMTSAEEYLRAGKTVEESQTMIKNSITMSKISAQSQKEVSEEMIAAMNAFGFTADQMGSQYVDKISALDSASATSSKDISEAVMHTAKSAQLAGVSWDYLLSSVTSVMDTTKKSGSEVGNAFKTIFSRMEAISKGKKDDDGTDINQVEKSLGKVGISLRKNEKEWRSMEDVLKDVQSRWSTFSSVTKSDIASKIGGTYQKETILTLMENQQKVQDLMKVTENSIGSADKKMDVYGKSTDARLNDLKHSWETLYMSMYNSDTINSVIGGIGNVINVLTQLVSTSKVTAIELLALSTTFVLMIKNWQGAIATIETVMTFFKLLPIAMAETGGMTALLSTSFKGLIGVFSTLLMTAPGLIFTGLAVAVGVATSSIISHSKHMADLKQQTDTLRTSYENLTQAMKDNNVESLKGEVKTQEQQQKKLNDLLKQKAELEGKMKNPSTTYDPRIDSAIKNADVSKLNEVNKAIEEQKKTMKEAGIDANVLANAKNQITTNENISKIKEETEEQINNKNSIIQQIQEYQNLASSKDENSTKTQRMTQLSQNLSENIKGLVVEKDKDGNVTIKNTDLLDKNVNMINDEISTVKTASNAKMEAAKQNAQYQIDETTLTYAEIKKRMEMYKKEAEQSNKAKLDAANELGVSSEFMNGMGSETVANQKTGEYQTALDDLDKIFNSNTNSVNNNTSALGEGYTPTSKDATSSTKALTAANKANTEATKEASNVTKDYDNQLKNLANDTKALDYQLGKLDEHSDAYINGLNTKKDLLQAQINLTKEAINANENSATSLYNLAGAYDKVNSSSSSGAWKGKYSNWINDAGAKNGLDPVLIAAIIQDESGFNPQAYNKSSGATGLGQFLSSTAREVGLKDRTDPQSSIYALASYLRTRVNQAGSLKGGIKGYGEGTEAYYNKIMGFYNQFKGGSVGDGGATTGDESGQSNISSVVSGAETAQSKVESLQSSLLDLQSQLDKLNIDAFNAKLGQFDDKIAHVNKNGELAKAKYDLYKNDGADVQQSDQYRDQIYKEINNRFSVLSQKENFIKQEMQNSFYDKATLANMQKTLEDVQLEKVKTLNELHSTFGEWIQNRYNDATKSNKDDIDELQQKLDEVDTRDKNNFQDKLELNKQMLSQQEEIKAKTIEQIAYVESLLVKEKESTTKQIWIEQIKQLNKDLSDTNKTITTIEDTVDELDLSSKLKEYDDDIKKITDTLSVLNEISSKSYDAKIDLTEKMIEADQKENGVLQERISLLEAERSRYAEGSDGYNESNDKLNDANSKYYENLAKEAQHNKDLIKDAEDKLMDEIENQIYGGDTQKQFETTYKAQITALDDELKAMSKQNDQLQEQETRQKNLLSLAEAQIKLQDAQNEKSVQQLVKSKDGSWQFQYVANQQTVDDLEKTMRDQVKSNTDWEKQTADKHKQESINDEKERLQAEIDIRSEALNTIKTNIEDALNNENNLFESGSTTVNGIVSSSLGDLKKLYSGNLGDIVDNVRYSVNTITSQFDSINSAFVNAQNNLGGISNQITNPQQQIPTVSQKYVFGSGADYVNAQKTLGNKYKYIDIGSMSDEERNSLKLQEGDVLLGGESVTSGVNIGSGQRLAGTSRTDTANQIQQYALDNQQEVMKTVYASGKDLENAISTLGNQYYNFVDISKASKEELQNIKGSDLVIGGSAVTGSVNDNANFTGAERIWGQDAQATADAIKKWQNDNINNENKYNNAITQIKQSSANNNTVIVKSALNGETTTIQKNSNTNMSIIKTSWDGINNITYDQMGNMVVTVKGKVAEASTALLQLIALQARAGINAGVSSSYSSSYSNSTSTTKPTIYATGSDATILRAQYGSSINIVNGTGLSGQAGTTRVETNQLYQQQLAQQGITPSKYISIDDMYKYDTGGYTGDWNSDEGKLAILHEKELVLNKTQTQDILNTVSILDKLNLPNITSILSKFDISNILPKLNLPQLPNFNNQQTQPIKQEISINAQFPNATNHEEIEKAFNSLSLDAIQYAHPSY